jgi:hypothetical protein
MKFTIFSQDLIHEISVVELGDPRDFVVKAFEVDKPDFFEVNKTKDHITITFDYPKASGEFLKAFNHILIGRDSGKLFALEVKLASKETMLTTIKLFFHFLKSRTKSWRCMLNYNNCQRALLLNDSAWIEEVLNDIK